MEYKGENTISIYYKVKSNIYIAKSLIAFAILVLVSLLLSLAIYLFIIVSPSLIVAYVLTIVFLVAMALIFAFIIWLLVSRLLDLKHAYKKYKYYSNVTLVNICDIIIPFDSKLWLTAEKDSFHPMEFNMNIDGVEKKFVTGWVFTNSDKYLRGHKDMPKELICRSYIDSYAKIGYLKERGEAIVIGFKKYK